MFGRVKFRDRQNKPTTETKNTALSKIELAEMIEEVRQQLAKARNETIGKDLTFKYESVELDIELAASKSIDPKIGINVWVIDAEAQGSLSDTQTHTIKVTLTPVDSADATE